MQRFVVMMVVVLGLVTPVAATRAQGGPSDAAAQKAIAYIRTQQSADGTFTGFGVSSTADAITALASAGVNVAEIKNGQGSAIDGLVRLAAEGASETGVAAKFVIAALLAGQNPRALGGLNMVTAIESGFNTTTNRYGPDVTSHALSLLALNAAGAMIRPAAVSALELLQLPDGGWSFDGKVSTGSDTNTTALAIQALVATGGSAELINKALGYLRAQQNPDAGFPYSQTSEYGNASDANSTALSIQAILATKASLTDWAREGRTPLDRLLAFQNPSGAFRFQDAQADDNQLATYQALPPLVGKTYPLEALLTIQPVPGTPVATPTGGTPLPTPTGTPALTPVVGTPFVTPIGGMPFATAVLPTPIGGTPFATAVLPTPIGGTPSATAVLPTPIAGGVVTLPDTGAGGSPLGPILLGVTLLLFGVGIVMRRRSA